jgi:hypothetical protein
VIGSSKFLWVKQGKEQITQQSNDNNPSKYIIDEHGCWPSQTFADVDVYYAPAKKDDRDQDENDIEHCNRSPVLFTTPPPRINAPCCFSLPYKFESCCRAVIYRSHMHLGFVPRRLGRMAVVLCWFAFLPVVAPCSIGSPT